MEGGLDDSVIIIVMIAYTIAATAYMTRHVRLTGRRIGAFYETSLRHIDQSYIGNQHYFVYDPGIDHLFTEEAKSGYFVHYLWVISGGIFLIVLAFNISLLNDSPLLWVGLLAFSTLILFAPLLDGYFRLKSVKKTREAWVVSNDGIDIWNYGRVEHKVRTASWSDVERVYAHALENGHYTFYLKTSHGRMEVPGGRNLNRLLDDARNHAINVKVPARANDIMDHLAESELD